MIYVNSCIPLELDKDVAEGQFRFHHFTYVDIFKKDKKKLTEKQLLHPRCGNGETSCHTNLMFCTCSGRIHLSQGSMFGFVDNSLSFHK